MTQVVNQVEGRARRPPRRRDQVELRAVAYEFKLPDLGEGLTEGEIARWLVERGPGDRRGRPARRDRDRQDDGRDPVAGRRASSRRSSSQEGEVVPVGTVLVVIGGERRAAAAGGGRPRWRPRSRATAARREGARDAARAAARARSSASTSRRSPAPARRGGSPRTDVRGTLRAGGAAPKARREPIRGVKRQMFEHLTRAHHEIPPVTWVEECDFTDVDLKQLLPLTLKAVAQSLQEFPELNARIDGNDLVYLDRYDIGVAVQTEQGLVVPVVRDVRRALARRARRRDASASPTPRTPASSRRRSCATARSPSRARASPRASSRRRSSTTRRSRSSASTASPSGRSCATAPSPSAGWATSRVTFDHRVIDGKRAADFGLAVIARLQTAKRRRRLGRCSSRSASIFGAVERPSSRATTRLPRDERERRHLRDPEALGDLGTLVDVDLLHFERAALLACDVREQALHPPRRARARDVKNTSKVRFLTQVSSDRMAGRGRPPRPERTTAPAGTLGRVGAWYWIGVARRPRRRRRHARRRACGPRRRRRGGRRSRCRARARLRDRRVAAGRLRRLDRRRARRRSRRARRRGDRPRRAAPRRHARRHGGPRRAARRSSRRARLRSRRRLSRGARPAALAARLRRRSPERYAGLRTLAK